MDEARGEPHPPLPRRGWMDWTGLRARARQVILGTSVTFPKQRFSGSGEVSHSWRSGAHTVAGQRRIRTCFPCIQHVIEISGSHGVRNESITNQWGTAKNRLPGFVKP